MAKTKGKTTRAIVKRVKPSVARTAPAQRRNPAVSGAVGGVVKSINFDEWARIFYGAGGPERVTRPYEQSVWVNACISQMADEIGGLERKISDDRDAILEAGEAYDLTERPNALMTGAEFFWESVANLLLGGEVFWVVAERDGLRPRQIAVYGSGQVEPILAKGRLVGWALKLADGGRQPMDLFDVRQVKFWNPYDPHRGLSPIRAASLAISQDYKASLYNDSMLTNGAEPGGVLQTDADMTPEQCEQAYANFEGRHQGPGKAKTVAILYGGLKYQAVASTMMDMQFQDLKRMNPEEICIAFKTPPPVVGLVNDVKYSNLGEAMKLYFRKAIRPLSDKLAEIFTMSFVQRLGRYWFWFDTDNHPAAVAEVMERMATVKTMVECGATFNDAAKRMGLGLPKYVWGDTWYKPMGLTDVRQPLDLGPVLPEPQDRSAATNPNDTNMEEQQRRQMDEMMDASPVEKGIVEKSLAVLKTSIWERWVSSIRPLEKKFEKRLAAYFYRQRRELLQRLERADRSVSKAIGKEDVLSILFDLTEEDGKLRATVQPLIGEAAAFGASQAADEVGLQKTFGLEDPLAIKAMRERMPKLQRVNRVTLEAVKKTLDEGIGSGETVAQLGQRLRELPELDAIGPMSKETRSMSIARTETAGAVSQGRLAGFQQAGVPLKAWLSSRDKVTRNTHLVADGRYTKNPIPVDQPFEVARPDGGKDLLMHPGDPAGSAGNVIHCRCCVLPVTTAGPVTKAIEQYAVIKFLTHSDWVQKAIKGT